MNIKSPIKLLPCRKCKVFCTSFIPQSSFLHCIKCICSTPNCNETWYICEKHSCRYNDKNHRFFSHFNQPYHNITVSEQCFHSTTSVSTDHNPRFNDNASIQSSLEVALLNSDKVDNIYTNDIFDDSSCSSILLTNPTDDSHHITKRQKTELTESTYVEPSSRFETNTEIFFLDEMNEKGNGIKGLVGRSFACNRNSKVIANDIESRLHTNLTYLCSTMTSQQQHLLSCILKDLMRPNIFEKTRPPLSTNDINKYYLNSSFSLKKNLPSPRVFEIDGHACVSIGSVIDHMLLFGVPMDTLSTDFKGKNDNFINDISQTKEAELIRNNIRNKFHRDSDSITIIYIIVWSDDFEVNHTRTNKSSTWVMTVSISPPSHLKTSPLCTSPIALGRKGYSHNKVRNHVNEEIRKLENVTMRYSSRHLKEIPVIVKPLIISADRPERSSLNSILSHSGNSSKRWRYSELIDRKKLPSCSQCLSKRFNTICNYQVIVQPSKFCNKCCDWNMMTKNKVSKFPPPHNYPTQQHQNSPTPPSSRQALLKQNQLLCTVKVDYDHFISCIKYAFWNFLHQSWNKGQCESYLKLVGISGQYIKQIVNLATTKRNLLPTDYSILEQIPFPPMWNSVYRLEQCIDTPMHLLFQGIVKSIILETQAFFKFHKKWASFGMRSNTILNEINKMHLEFCRAEHFNGGDQYTTGGWIAETYLGFSRLFTYLVTQTSEDISKQNLLADKEFRCMIQSLHSLISRLMCNNNISYTEIDSYVKIFLSCCHKYWVAFYADSANSKTLNPFWNSANFLSLLNLPKQIQQFGSMRLHWEGIHERFIQHVKPYLKNMRTSTTYLLLKLQEIHDNHVLKEVLMGKKLFYLVYIHVITQSIYIKTYPPFSKKSLKNNVLQAF